MSLEENDLLMEIPMRSMTEKKLQNLKMNTKNNANNYKVIVDASLLVFSLFN